MMFLEEPAFWVVALVVVSFLSIWLLTVYLDRKRSQAMLQAADELGLPFEVEGSAQMLAELGIFKLFSQGRGKKIRNVFRGDTEEVQAVIFDYQYTVGHGKHSHTFKQTVAAVRCPSLRLPRFTLCPENFFHKLGSMFGYQDIDFDTHPVFSSRYLLRGDNERSIRAAFTPEVLEHFEQIKGVRVEGNTSQLIYYRPGKRLKPDAVRDFLEQALRTLARFSENAPNETLADSASEAGVWSVTGS